MSKSNIIVFLRKPKLGHGKTRLSQGIGEEETLKVYLALLHKTIKTLISLSGKFSIHIFIHSGGSPSDKFQDYFNKTFGRVYLQKEGDLGEKLADAFHIVHGKGDKTLVIGSDLWKLDELVIQVAADWLKNYPAVIGPSEDGGYYLLGFNGSFECANYQDWMQVFASINWSTESVFKEQMQKLLECGLSVKSINHLSDLDTMEDYLDLKEEINCYIDEKLGSLDDVCLGDPVDVLLRFL